MWEINESFKDSTELSGFVSILLKSDKPLNPYHVSYPITWSGFVNNEPIEIVQPSENSSYMSDFEFTKYPE